MEWCGVAAKLVAQFESFTRRKNCEPMIAKSSTHKNFVAGLYAMTAQIGVGAKSADAGCANEEFVHGATWHDFGIAGHNRNARLLDCFLDAADNTAQRLDRQSFFQDEREGQVKRVSARNGEV